LRTRSRLFKFILPLLTLAVAISVAGCSTNRHGSAPSGARTGNLVTRTELTSLIADFRVAVNRPQVKLTPRLGLKAPAGFAQADVDSLAQRAVGVLKRSAEPKLSSMSPDDAIDYVYAHQFTATKLNFQDNASSASAGYAWQWVAASRYRVKPTAPKVIKIAAAVTTDKGSLDTGQSAPILRVTVQAHIVQMVLSDHGTVPIVSVRSVQASGFRPRGGAVWWPSVITRDIPLGNTACGLYKNRLDPITDPDELRVDLAHLRITMKSKTLVPVDFGNHADNKAARKAYEDCVK
jgi:hypothetical protein